MRLLHIAATTFFVLLTTACANYDFAKARQPDGSYDVPKLIADLEESGEHELRDGIWLPGIWLSYTSFERSESGLPDGYSLSECDSFGPLFFCGDLDSTAYDRGGTVVETTERDWFGSGVLFNDRELDVQTPWGRRHADRDRYLLVFGPKDDVCYFRNEPPR